MNDKRMTKEEAIGNLRYAIRWNDTPKKEALEMAIKALEQGSCEDCISRQAVNILVDELARAISDERCFVSRGRDTGKIMQDILDLPSVTSQQKYEDIAKAFQFGLAFGFGEKYDEMDNVINEIKKVITSQPKTGHWIAQDIHNCHTDFKCSECGYIHSFMHLYGKPTADYTYCPNCGCRMIELQESEE